MTDKKNILRDKAYEYATKGNWTHQTHSDKIFYPGTGDIERYTHYLNGLIDAQEEIERLKTALSTYHGLAVKDIKAKAEYGWPKDLALETTSGTSCIQIFNICDEVLNEQEGEK